MRHHPQPDPTAVEIDGRLVPLTITRSRRARRITVRLLTRNHGLGLTLPPRVAVTEGLAFVATIRPRIAAWLAAQPARVALEPGADVLVEGLVRRIVHEPALGRQVVLEADQLRVGGPLDRVPARLLRWLKARAAADLTLRTQAMAAAHGLTVARISFGDARGRWGSCTSAGAIRFSWRLIGAPEAVRTYVVAHELAHLRHMNHSPAFWAEVARLGGDRSARGWLRSHGPLLHRIGA
jgi:hypothetical protein